MKVLGMGFLIPSMIVAAGCGVAQGKEAAESAVAEFHSRLNGADFASIYSASHPDFKTASSETDFVAILNAVHSKLGPIVGQEQTKWHVNSVNLKTNVTLTYRTRFLEGDAVETFAYRIEGEKAELYGYNINSSALIIK